MLPVNSIIDTKIRFFGQKILLESSGSTEIDKALKSTFKDDYLKIAPLQISRDDCQVLLKWIKGKVKK